jgi:hypothetical protein
MRYIGDTQSLDVMCIAESDEESVCDTAPDESLEARLDAEATAAYHAGRVVPHSKVAEWLNSWGKPDALPHPRPEPR